MLFVLKTLCNEGHMTSKQYIFLLSLQKVIGWSGITSFGQKQIFVKIFKRKTISREPRRKIGQLLKTLLLYFVNNIENDNQKKNTNSKFKPSKILSIEKGIGKNDIKEHLFCGHF